MNTLINDISSFSLSIFGIGITLFTVIYSFISNKREYMNEISHIITSGKACPEAKAKYIIAEKYIQKQKRINAIILSVTIASFVVYTLCLLYLHIASDNIVLKDIIIGLAIILISSLCIALSMFISSYLKYIK